jgi:hypothetical protein
MLRSPESQSIHRRRIAIAGLSVAVTVAALGAWLAVADPHQNAAPAPRATIDPAGHTVTSGSEQAAQPVEQLRRVAATPDPRTFAESVAGALFDWDTTAPIALNDYTGRLLAVADPTGQESPGLVADLAGYLPTAEAWVLLKPYYTRQWLEISSVKVPDLWEQALAEAGPQSLAPGTTAYTITGTRHRSGVWEDEPVTSEHEVAFTVFIACEPSYPTCHLLRLSRPDEPLD